MAVVKNITPDVRSVFSTQAPPLQPGDKTTIPDARFVGRAWPKSTWEVVEPPEGFEDVGPKDAYVFAPAAPKPEPKSTADPKRGSKS